MAIEDDLRDLAERLETQLERSQSKGGNVVTLHQDEVWEIVELLRDAEKCLEGWSGGL